MEPQRTLPTFRPEMVPRWAKAAAWGVLASVMPSVLWRLTMSIHALATGDNPCAGPEITPAFELVYIVALLPIAQVGAAALVFGLIRPWGEVFPRWMPVVGGRAVPVAFGAGIAAAGALAVAVVFDFDLGEPRGELPPGCTQPGWDVLAYYAPLVLWGPLLMVVTLHYVWRRSIERSMDPVSSRRASGRRVRG